MQGWPKIFPDQGVLVGEGQVLLSGGQWHHLDPAPLRAACTERRDQLQGWSKTLPDQGVLAGKGQVLLG